MLRVFRNWELGANPRLGAFSNPNPNFAEVQNPEQPQNQKPTIRLSPHSPTTIAPDGKTRLFIRWGKMLRGRGSWVNCNGAIFGWGGFSRWSSAVNLHTEADEHRRIEFHAHCADSLAKNRFRLAGRYGRRVRCPIAPSFVFTISGRKAMPMQLQGTLRQAGDRFNLVDHFVSARRCHDDRSADGLQFVDQHPQGFSAVNISGRDCR